MTGEYMTLVRSIRDIRTILRELTEAFRCESVGYATGSLNSLLINAVNELARQWPDENSSDRIEALKVAVKSVGFRDCWTIGESVLPRVEDALDDFYSANAGDDVGRSIVDLLHPAIISNSYSHFRSTHYRDSVLNAFIAVFDLIRSRTGLDMDGSALVDAALSLSEPHLIISELESESGRNEQKGYIQILKGAFQAVRNPKAHSLNWETSQLAAGQLLVFASLMCRRIEESTIGPARG